MGRVVIDKIRRTSQLTVEEERFSEWARGRPDDLFVVFTTVWSSNDQFPPYDVTQIWVEKPGPDGRMYGFHVQPINTRLPESWETMESLCRMALDQHMASLLDMP